MEKWIKKLILKILLKQKKNDEKNIKEKLSLEYKQNKWKSKTLQKGNKTPTLENCKQKKNYRTFYWNNTHTHKINNLYLHFPYINRPNKIKWIFL